MLIPLFCCQQNNHSRVYRLQISDQIWNIWTKSDLLVNINQWNSPVHCCRIKRHNLLISKLCYMAQIYRNIKENGKPMQDFTRALIGLYTLSMCMYLEINLNCQDAHVIVCEEDLSFWMPRKIQSFVFCLWPHWCTEISNYYYNYYWQLGSFFPGTCRHYSWCQQKSKDWY